MKEKDSNFKVNLTTIREINPHPNPEVHSLCIAKIYDFDVIISSKSDYKVGDSVVYFPVNSVLPSIIENFMFPADSKVKLQKSRVKAIRIQKFVSQGLIAKWKDIKELYSLKELNLETDLQDKINVTKYHPPTYATITEHLNKKKSRKTKNCNNPLFNSYNGCVNIKWLPYALKDSDEVYITEKIHGTNFRCGWLPFKPHGIWEKIKQFFRLNPKNEFCYGSNNVQRQRRKQSPTWYKDDVYAEAVYKYSLKDIMKEHVGYILYGEIYGPTIQKGYSYGLDATQRNLAVFDIFDSSKNEWLTLDAVKSFCKDHSLRYAPVLYEGKWDKDFAVSLASGNSKLCPQQKVIEGVVVKNKDITSTQRVKLKIINPDYLMKEADGETSDFQ
jgi:RNA ligase (TIGR02306 family)